VQAHHQKFWFVKNPGKILENLGRILENLGRILVNPGKNGAQRCLISKNSIRRLQKNARRRVFGGHTEEGLHDLCGRKFVAKSRTRSLFGQVCANSGKSPSHPQKFACSYNYGECNQQAGILFCWKASENTTARGSASRVEFSELSRPVPPHPRFHNTASTAEMTTRRANLLVEHRHNARRCKPPTLQVFASPRITT